MNLFRSVTTCWLILLVLLLPLSGLAQDAQYSQPYANQVMLNPAFTGSAMGPRVALNYRAQWVAIPGSFRQFAVTYDQPINFGRSLHGLGITLNTDRAGEGNLTKLEVIGNYAFSYEFGRPGREHYLRAGISGGFQQASIDFYKLRFSDQIDPREGFINATSEIFSGNTYFIPDVNAGMAYYNKYFWASVTVNHITEPDQVFIGLSDNIDPTLPRRYTATIGARLPLEQTYTKYDEPTKTISPVVMYRQQREFTQIDAGFYVTLEPMVFGLWYRNQDAIAGLVGFRHGIFSIGYSYDYTFSRLTNGISGGSHEIAIVMEFERNRPMKFKHKKMPCPRF